MLSKVIDAGLPSLRGKDIFVNINGSPVRGHYWAAGRRKKTFKNLSKALKKNKKGLRRWEQLLFFLALLSSAKSILKRPNNFIT